MEQQQQQLETAKQQAKQMVQQAGVQPAVIAQLGKMSISAMKDPAIAEMLKQQLIQNKLADENDFQDGINPVKLASFAALGRLVEQMMQTGELGGAV
jgi:hypothetical protein